MPVPTHVQDLATACVASAKAVVNIELDFTTDTLPILDHYAQQALGEDATQEQALGLIAPMCGAYFGEVVRRRFEMLRWHAPPDEYGGWRLEGENIFVYFNPIGVALEVLTQADADGWNAHVEVQPKDRDAVKHAVELFGAVRETDYYSFGIRLETLEQILESLVREARVRGEKRTFGSAMYEAEVLKRQVGPELN
ncbi:MAG: hypothetical protein AAGE52_08025 [Myxococcota bacterium]